VKRSNKKSIKATLALPPQEITSVLDEIALLRSNFSAPPLNSLNIRAVLKLLVLLKISYIHTHPFISTGAIFTIALIKKIYLINK
jgi:hypothetical protein